MKTLLLISILIAACTASITLKNGEVISADTTQVSVYLLPNKTARVTFTPGVHYFVDSTHTRVQWFPAGAKSVTVSDSTELKFLIKEAAKDTAQ